MNQIGLKIRHILLPYCLTWFLSPLPIIFLLKNDSVDFFRQWLSVHDLSWMVIPIWSLLIDAFVMAPRFRHISVPSHSRVAWINSYGFVRADRYFFNSVSLSGLLLGNYLSVTPYFQYMDGIAGQSNLAAWFLSLLIPLLLISWILFSPLRQWQEEASGGWL